MSNLGSKNLAYTTTALGAILDQRVPLGKDIKSTAQVNVSATDNSMGEIQLSIHGGILDSLL